MASLQLDALRAVGSHEVGHINSASAYIRTLINGAIVKSGLSDVPAGQLQKGIDNFVLGQVYYDKALVANDERGAVVKVVDDSTATKNNLFLIATPEQRLEGEPLSNFYNADGERATCVYLTAGLNFETSAFTKIDGTKDPEVGQYAYFDGATQKFVISDAEPVGKPVVFLVVGFEADTYYSIDDRELVQLEVLA